MQLMLKEKPKLEFRRYIQPKKQIKIELTSYMSLWPLLNGPPWTIWTVKLGRSNVRVPVLGSDRVLSVGLK